MSKNAETRSTHLTTLHHHVHEQVTQVISGQMRFWFGENKEQTMELFPGDVIIIPCNVPHAALMIGEVEGLDTWSPPRRDWLDKTDDYEKIISATAGYLINRMFLLPAAMKNQPYK